MPAYGKQKSLVRLPKWVIVMLVVVTVWVLLIIGPVCSSARQFARERATQTGGPHRSTPTSVIPPSPR